MRIVEILAAILGGGFLILWGNSFLFAADPENPKYNRMFHAVAYCMFCVALAGVWLVK